MKRILKAAVPVGTVAVLLGVLAFNTTGAKAALLSAKVPQSGPPVCAAWTVVPSPNAAGISPNTLSGVAAVSASDVWAVGNSGDQKDGGPSLIEHWNGTQWQIVNSPNPGTVLNTLYSASAVSATDIWAVGFFASGPGLSQTLIEHWDGTSWSVVASPSPGSSNNELFSVSADSASDVWAVGFTDSIGAHKQISLDDTLVEHWNGTRWSVVQSPNPGSTNNHLEGVTAISPSDVWAVGTGVTDSGQTLTEHWNGTHWSVVSSPSPGTGGDLRAVTAISASDVWAVGAYVDTTGQTLTEHWNGTSWSVVPSPSVGTDPNLLSGVAAVSSTNVWTVGDDFLTSDFMFQTVTEQWDGSQWHVVTSPSPGTFISQLMGVTAIAANDIWAVGTADGTTLIEHYAPVKCMGPTS